MAIAVWFAIVIMIAIGVARYGPLLDPDTQLALGITSPLWILLGGSILMIVLDKLL